MHDTIVQRRIRPMSAYPAYDKARPA